MHKIFYTTEAKKNIKEIFSYISDDNIFYAAKTINQIKTTVDILKMFPLSWKGIGNNTRMIVESTYKYKIVYETKADEVFILSIFKYKNLWE